MRGILFLIMLATFASRASLHAQTVSAGSSQLLSQGPGAEAQALAGTVVSTIHDTTSLYWNPAGLSYAGGMVSGEHLFLFDGARYDFVGLSVPSRLGTFALGALQLNRDNIIARATIDDPGTTVSNTQSVYLVGYSHTLGDHWSVGVTANILDFNIDGYTDKGWGLDAGAQGHFDQEEFLIFKRVVWSVGGVVKNLIEPQINLAGDPETYPRELRAGAAMSFQTASRPETNGVVDHDRATFLFSVRQVSGDQVLYPALGFAYDYLNILIFRVGFDGAISAGMGVHTLDDRFSLDYSMEDNPFALNHRFTISYRFAAPIVKPQEIFREVVDDEYEQAKSQAESLAQDSFKQGEALFKEQLFKDAQEPFRLAAILDPDNHEAEKAYQRALKAYRLQAINLLSTDATLNPLAGEEGQAYRNIASLLNLGEENTVKLSRALRAVVERITPNDYDKVSQEVFDKGSEAARQLLAIGHVGEAQTIAQTLEIVESPQTKEGVTALKRDISDKGNPIRKNFNDLFAEEGNQIDLKLAESALEMLRAFPNDAQASAKAKAVIKRYHSQYPLSIKESFYLRRLYYLAAVRYVKKSDANINEAVSYLKEILMSAPANTEADALLDAMVREGLAQR